MEKNMASEKQKKYIKYLSFKAGNKLSSKPLDQLSEREAHSIIKSALEGLQPSGEEVSSSSLILDYSDVEKSDRPEVDFKNPMQYRLTFFTRVKKGGRLKVYTYYWESPEQDQQMYKVRSDYIEFLTYKFKDAPHFCNGVLSHREKTIQVYDTTKEHLVSRFTPVTLRKTNPVTKEENFDLDYNYFSEKAKKNGTRAIEIGS